MEGWEEWLSSPPEPPEAEQPPAPPAPGWQPPDFRPWQPYGPGSDPGSPSPAPPPAPPQLVLGGNWEDGPGSPERTSDATTSPPGKAHRRLRRVTVGIAVVLVVVAGATVAIAARSNRPPSSTTGGESLVASAVRTTMSHRTAEIEISGFARADGVTVPLNGSGEMAFGRGGGFTGTVSTTFLGHSIVEQELIVDDRFFLGINVDGDNVVSSLDPGKQWVEVAIPAGSSSGVVGTGTVDPLSQLQQLTKKGYVVHPLGTSVVGGERLTGYRVVMSRQLMAAAVRQEMDQLPAVLRTALRKESLGPAVFDVWLDGKLVRRVIATMQEGGPAGTSTDVAMTFERYGVPASISAPPPQQVMSLAAFARLAGSGLGG